MLKGHPLVFFFAQHIIGIAHIGVQVMQHVIGTQHGDLVLIPAGKQVCLRDTATKVLVERLSEYQGFG